MKAQGETEESEKLSKMSSLLERLHAKFNQNRPWSETIKLVRQVMEKRVVMSSGGHQHLVSCLETLQKALKGIPLFETQPTYVPLYELITQFELSKDPDPIPLNHNMRFYA
uniref:Mediator complex subunit 1 n=1 Tax=Equus caballus TaxID=9796 RepID=A0A9L0RRP0_HORSE